MTEKIWTYAKIAASTGRNINTVRRDFGWINRGVATGVQERLNIYRCRTYDWKANSPNAVIRDEVACAYIKVLTSLNLAQQI